MKILIINRSTRVAAAELATMAAAVDLQVKQHFAPSWGLVPSDVQPATAPAPDAATILLLDAPDAPGALGYHEETGGEPDGKVFVGPVLDNGGVVLADGAKVSVASVLSHEVLELLADPQANRWVDGPDRAEGSCYALEVCDPVESDSYLVTVEGQAVSVSNFALPAWFDPEAKGRVDWLGLCPAPFALRAGGYLIVRGSSGAQQVFGESRPSWRQGARGVARLNFHRPGELAPTG